jgi:hypothetical protein
MKDTILSARWKKRELMILLFSFIAAFLFNIYAVLRYSHPAKEIFTQIHIVLMLTMVFYAIIVLFRFIWWLFYTIYLRFTKS